MSKLLINIDVPDLNEAVEFYQQALSLRIGRRLGEGAVELLGLPSPVYLLQKDAGSFPFIDATQVRSYERHWCPVHLDFVVDDIYEARKNLISAGAKEESPIEIKKWGKIAMFQDPFGHGLCVIEFVGKGYDEILIS